MPMSPTKNLLTDANVRGEIIKFEKEIINVRKLL